VPAPSTRRSAKACWPDREIDRVRRRADRVRRDHAGRLRRRQNARGFGQDKSCLHTIAVDPLPGPASVVGSPGSDQQDHAALWTRWEPTHVLPGPPQHQGVAFRAFRWPCDSRVDTAPFSLLSLICLVSAATNQASLSQGTVAESGLRTILECEKGHRGCIAMRNPHGNIVRECPWS